MERRKVCKLGAASLVVSLPVAWVRLTGIRKGDEVYAYPRGLSLIITPRERKRERGAAEVVLLEGQDAQGAVIEVFARYVSGFDSIRVVNRASRKELDSLLEAVDSHLLGVEVLSQSADSATLQVFTREHASLPMLLKRLRFVVNSLCALLLQELRKPEFDSSQIKVLTKSAFKLYFLVLRLVYGAARGSRELAESRSSFAELLSYALCAKNIGGVLDAIMKIVRAYDGLGKGFEHDAALIESVSKAASLYERCFTAFIRKEKMDFGAVRRERRELIVAVNCLPQSKGLFEEEARVLRDTQLLAYELADNAGELMELAANIEGFE